MIEVTVISVCSILMKLCLRENFPKIIHVFNAAPGLKPLAARLAPFQGCLHAAV